jgi:hypothetical protein
MTSCFIICFFCEQDERAKLLREVECAETWRQKLEQQLVTCRKVISNMREEEEEEISILNVSDLGFSPFEIRFTYLFSSSYS